MRLLGKRRRGRTHEAAGKECAKGGAKFRVLGFWGYRGREGVQRAGGCKGASVAGAWRRGCVGVLRVGRYGVAGILWEEVWTCGVRRGVWEQMQAPRVEVANDRVCRSRCAAAGFRVAPFKTGECRHTLGKALAHPHILSACPHISSACARWPPSSVPLRPPPPRRLSAHFFRIVASKKFCAHGRPRPPFLCVPSLPHVHTSAHTPPLSLCPIPPACPHICAHAPRFSASHPSRMSRHLVRLPWPRRSHAGTAAAAAPALCGGPVT
eukprot:206834-Chlamydomonas_euryale.AAC.2